MNIKKRYRRQTMKKEIYNLTNPQKSIWLTEQFYNGTCINNICGTMLIKNKVDFPKLKQAIHTFVQDNDAFRLNFFNDNTNEIKQQILPIENFDIPTIDVINDSGLLSLEEKIVNTPFDLTKLLFNFTMFRFSDGTGGFVICMHHLISDACTSGLVANKIINIYTSLLKNEETSELPTSYTNYIKTEKDYLTSNKFEKDKQYWNTIFETPSEIGNIPSIKQENTNTCSAARKAYTLSKEEISKINNFCSKNKFSIFNFFMALYAIYIKKVSGLDDFVLGTPILNRSTFVEKNTPGMFISTIPFRFTLTNSLSFIDFAQKIASDSLGMFRHQKYPYQNILEDIRKKNPSQPNLYDILISYQNTRTNRNTSEIPYEVRWTFNNNLADSMQIHLFDMNDTGLLTIYYDYRLDKYNSEEIDNIHNRICYMIEQILENESLTIDNIKTVTPKEQNIILNEFNNTLKPYTFTNSIIEMIEKTAQSNPNNIAIETNNCSITYKELMLRVNQLSNYLLKNNISENNNIGIFTTRTIDTIIGILSILKINCTYVPIDVEYPIDRISYMIETSKIKYILSEDISNFDKISNINNLEKIAINYLDYKNEDKTFNTKYNYNNNTNLYIIFTSGSTGKPKGVTISHKNMMNLILFEKNETNLIENNNKILQFATMSFDVSYQEIYSALLFGNTLVLIDEASRKDMNKLSKYIFDKGITTLFIPPAYLKLLVEDKNIRKLLTTCVKNIITAGEALVITDGMKDLIESGIQIHNHYGPAETHVATTFTIDKNNISIHPPIGKPISNANIHILDTNLKLCPIGVVGQIAISGDCVGNGYFNNVNLTNEKFIINSYNEKRMYLTGDLGFFDKDGNVHFIGRSDFQVKINGFRVELEEISQILLKHPDVKSCVTIIHNENNKKYIITYYVEENSTKEEDLIKYLKTALPFYMIPKKLIKLEKLPINTNGKIDKTKLPKVELLDLEDEFIEPSTSTQLHLAQIWKTLFNVDKIGANYNFFDIGGDSLLAIKLSSIIQSSFNATVTVGEIFATPTLSELSALIDKKQQVENNNITPCEKKDFYHLSSAQKRIYYSSKMSGDSSTLYNMPGAIIFDKKPDINKLNECFKKLIERHSALRTSFEIVDDEVYQKVVDDVDFEVKEVVENDKTIDDMIKEFVKPFDLTKAPLVRASLVSLKDEVLLLFDMHHIISDGLSLSILTTELCKLYNGDELAENKIQYVDYAEWEYKNLKENNMKESKDFWINQFKDDIPVLNMPTDYVRPAVQSFEGAKVYKTIPKDLTEKINSLARKLDVSNYMLLLACYYVLLSKYTNQEDIVVGSPVIGRDKEELLNIMGVFVNSLALKNHIDSSMSFYEFLNNVKSNSIKALSHQVYPFDELVNNLNITRDNSRSPLFDTMFIYQNDGMTPVHFNGINAKYYFPDTKISKFDLSLEVVPSQNVLALNFEYCTKLFNKNTIERFSEHFINILEKIVDNYNLKIADIDILSVDERNKILYEFNDTYLDYDKSKTVVNYFEEQVQKTPNNIALVFGDKSFTYKDINEKANQLAHYLYDKGVRLGDSIGIMLHRAPEMIIGIIAILKVGASYTPIDPEYPIDRINYILKDSNTKKLLVHSSTLNILSDDYYEKINVDINCDIFKTNKTENLNISIPTDSLIYMIYTSGSTGNPKGVMVTHKNINNFILAEKQLIDFAENKVMLSITTICFDIFALEIWCSLTSGMKLVLANDAEQLSPNLLRTLCLKNNVNMVQTTPSRYSAVLLGADNLDFFDNFTDIMVGGEPFPKTLLEKLQQCCSANIFNMYGPTETTVWSTFKDLTNTSNITIGRPIGNTTCYILDKDKNLLPPCIPGELYIGGDGVTKGYWKREDLTNEKFITSPFRKDEIIYNTNDLAYFTIDGEIVHLGRTDSQVKIRGYRIELEEIENKLLKLPFIKKVTVVKQNIENRDFISAYYVATTPLKTNEIRKFLSTSLPDYMIPSYFTQLEDFPYTPNGKIDKNALPLPDISSKENTIQYVAPRNNTEIALVTILENILKVSNISVLDNFFSLGGDSLTAIVLCTNVKRQFNVEISFKDVMNNPIIEDLASIIDNTQTTNNTSIIKNVQKRDYYPASSAQKRMYLASQMDNDSTLYNIAGGVLLDTLPDVDKLQKVFNTIIKRHESLRTYFDVIDGNIVQKIVENLDIKITVEKVNTSNIDELFTKYQSVFNINKAPLFNVFLLIMPNNKVLLMLDVHHIIFDGTSLNNLIQEVSTLYNEKDLTKLDISYKDFAVWEEEQLLKDGFKDSKDFWIKQFKDDIPILNMPTSYPRPASKSYEGTTFVNMLSKELTTKVNNFASKYNVTPYMLMLCVYYILLYKYTNQEDIVVGSPISGRNHSELEPLLGMFVNSIPLKANISSNSNFEELLTNIKDVCINAFAHQDYPFDVLVSDLNIPRDASRNPLFDTMFIYQNNGYSAVDFNGINANICVPTSHTSKFDISVEVVPIDDTLKLSFEYCTKLFNEEFINSFEKHYENILNIILEQPNIKISDISMLTEDEKNEILYSFNNTKLDYPKNKTLANLFEEQVEKTPNNIAIVFEDKKLTYKQLNEKANQLAHYLNKKGIKQGDIIGIMLPRSLEVLIAILGVLKTGACYIPIDVTLPSNRINYMLSNSNVNILLTKNTITSDISVDTILDVNLNNIDIYSGNNNNLNIKVNPDSPSYMIYTSGSTGTPKGVVLKHKALVNLATYLNNSVEFLKDEYSNIAMASITTISFDIFIFETLICLQRGLKIIIANEAEQNTPNLLDELITRNDVKAIQMTPSRMYIFINNKNLMPHLNNLKYIVLAGEALPKDLLDRILQLGNIKVYNGYGPSETTVFSTFTDVTNYEEITIGKPLGNTRIYILDKDMNICPIGNAGEIYIAGDGVGIGYSNNEKITKERFIKDIFYPNEIMYKTGDLGTFLPNGEIHYIGRVDNQIKIRGLRIELDEIENCILKYPNIKKCIITADTDSNHRQFIVAYLLVNDRISVNKLRMFLKTMLPKYMVPSYFIVLDKLPYLNNGKINKKALPKPEVSKTNSERVAYIAPTNKLELQIAEIFQNLLSISPIGIDDNFFELGGDSLLAINLQVELLKLNLNITYSDIFMKPTIRELAKKISSNETSTFNNIDTNEFLGFNTILDNICNMPKKLENKEIGNVIITGTTGFLGAHVLDNFLKTEKGIAYCLIRTEPGLTLENKLIKKLHFYFGDKYDKYIGNRIVIVNADIVENNLGLSDEEMKSIADNTSCVINCAAKVSHFGNYNAYKKVNVNGTENLLKFCLQFNKRFYQISTLSVSGINIDQQSYMEQSFEHDVIFRENNFYINQSLDNVYVRSKFEAEKLVLQYILKGLDAYILRVGNLMNRYEDGKFQPNVDENAYISRLFSLANVGCIPDYLKNNYLEFTPIDSCAEAIIKIIKHPSKENRIFHLYNHNHVDVDIFIDFVNKYFPFCIVSNDEFINKINNIFKQKNSNTILSGILRDFDVNKKLVYESKIKIKSEFSIEYLSKIGFEWPYIDENYLTKFLDYFRSIGYIKREEKD